MADEFRCLLRTCSLSSTAMANPKLPDGAVSKRSLTVRFGFNSKHVKNLLATGVLHPLGPGISAESVSRLQEGLHYIVCLACGAKQAAITVKHLRACSGLSLTKYSKAYPQAALVSTVTDERRVKTEAQRLAQSRKLKARFQTPEGEETRRQISAASKRLMQTPYRAKASEALTQYNWDHRQEKATESRLRWQDPVFRAKMREVHERSRDAILTSVANARGHLTKTFTKPHRALEEALLEAGVLGLEREFPIGPYRVDEALPSIKVALEVDGCYWHGCQECGFHGRPEILALDKRKNTYLLRRGWRVIRISEHRIKGNLPRVIAEILEVCDG